jgi:hypothetical protein
MAVPAKYLDDFSSLNISSTHSLSPYFLSTLHTGSSLTTNILSVGACIIFLTMPVPDELLK